MSFENIPFSVISKRIEEQIVDPTLVVGKVFSYLKVVQHALSFSIIQAKEKKIKHPYFGSYGMTLLKYRVSAAVKSDDFKKTVLKKIVFFEGARVEEENGKRRSVIFDRIMQVFSPDAISWIDLAGKLNGTGDGSMAEMQIVRKALDLKEKTILQDMFFVFEKLKNSKRFSLEELDYIGSSFVVFFESFRKYYRFLKDQPTQTVFLYTHYHQEGMLAACKLLNIRSIELQHGLIASNDLYYVYDRHWIPALTNALFPDQMAVFGDYWKNLLLKGHEWTNEQIIVAGDYVSRDVERESSKGASKENIVLIAAQKNLPEVYVAYSKKLSEFLAMNYPDWKLQVKLHPLEKEVELYKSQLTDANTEVILLDKSIDLLLNSAKIQISIYSTTFFDALGKEVCNFALMGEGVGEDYAQDLIDQGMAIELRSGQDPIELFLSSSSKGYRPMNRSSAYSVFRPENVQSWL